MAFFAAPALGVRVNDREIELVFGGVEVDKQVVDFVQHCRYPRVRPVDLVDDDDLRQVRFERLHEHVAGLRQGTLARIHQQHHAIDQFQRALDLAAEVAVARRVYDIDLDAVVADAGGFRQNRDAAFALEVVRIHDAFHESFVVAEDPALPQHGIHKRGLAVIDVRDDGDIADVLDPLRLVGDGQGFACYCRITHLTMFTRIARSSHSTRTESFVPSARNRSTHAFVA